MSDPAELFERLRRLRREGPGAAAPVRPTEVRAPMPADPGRADVGSAAAPGPAQLALDLLAERARRLSVSAGAVPAAEPAPRSTRSVGPLADLEPVEGEHGRYAVRRRSYAREARHGDFALAEVAHADRATLACLARDPRLAELDLERAVFLDIETTGLSGGAGTIPFLVALGSFTSEGFVLWQGFLPGPEGERALLAEVAVRVRAAAGIVSFFGKSFDRHRLEDKMRMHRIAPPFDSRPHLDLYHPCARLYRAALGDGRLSTFERILCGVEREDDLPGSFAPEAWFDFLAGRAHRLEAVFRHNELDVLSLVTLAAHLGRTLVERRADGAELAGFPAARAAALARLLAGEGEHEQALAWTERALARSASRLEATELAGRAARDLRLRGAVLKRRLGRTDEARAELETLAREAADELALAALVELAKLCEHERGDPKAALAAVERAGALALVLAHPGRAATGDDLGRRAERLRRKAAGRMGG